VKVEGAPWDYEVARSALNRLAMAMHDFGRWKASARLFADARLARGIRTRVAFIRRLKRAALPELEIDTALLIVDGEQDAHELFLNKTISRTRSRAPVERLIDAAVGFGGRR